MTTLNDLITKLSTEGGCIVSSADCHEIEITDAQVRGDFVVLDGGLGFVRRLPEWMQKHSRYARGAKVTCEE
jgi:hypothetical protein